MHETTAAQVGTYLSFATAQTIPLADIDRALKAHFALEWGLMDPHRRAENAQALWGGEGTVLTHFTVGEHTLNIETDRKSGETHVFLAGEPVILA